MKTVSAYGLTGTYQEWADLLGVSYQAVCNRVNRHGSPFPRNPPMKPFPADKKNNPDRYWDDFFRWKGVE